MQIQVLILLSVLKSPIQQFVLKHHAAAFLHLNLGTGFPGLQAEPLPHSFWTSSCLSGELLLPSRLHTITLFFSNCQWNIDEIWAASWAVLKSSSQKSLSNKATVSCSCFHYHRGSTIRKPLSLISQLTNPSLLLIVIQSWHVPNYLAWLNLMD